jgi:hypothetical protein
LDDDKYTILVDKPVIKGPLGVLDANRRTLLKEIGMWTRFIWLKTGTSGRLF